MTRYIVTEEKKITIVRNTSYLQLLTSRTIPESQQACIYTSFWSSYDIEGDPG